MRKWMVEFLRKFENRGINSILITESINLQLFNFFFMLLGVRCDVDIFTLTASAKSINRKLYDI